MKAKAISIHSARGGTGKTIIATNLALTMAKKGHKIALLDLDFRAPSLNVIFSKAIGKTPKHWLNDYLNGHCTEEQAVMDISRHYGLEGTLLLGLANPSVEAIRNMLGKSGAWEVTAVKKLFALLSTLFDGMAVECCLLDTSPGIQYSSINSAVSSDLTVVVTTLDSLDLEGTKNMLADLYDPLSRKTFVLVNKYSPETRTSKSEGSEAVALGVEKFLKHPVIGVIPCYCDVLQRERASTMALNDPTHPFVEKIEEVAKKLEEMA
jgi:MinD-like ATPase involved in chromosome partitioning or flagellar assembly